MPLAQSPVVLLVEDDDSIRQSVRNGLMEQEFEVLCAGSLAEARVELEQHAVDLMVLDLGLPDGDGFDFLRRQRAVGRALPVILLTARDQVADKVRGLDLGADDYLVKPFDFNELSARIRAHLRRSATQAGPTIRVTDMEIDLRTRMVRRAAEEISCTPREFDVLVYLATHAGQPVSRDVLTREVWKVRSRMTSMDNVIDVLMSRLRDKVDGDRPDKLLRTVRGLGFMLREPD